MGLEAAKSRSATAEERIEIQRLLSEGIDAGGCGWSMQRFGKNSIQSDYDGTPMPTDLMTDEDCLALAEVLCERDEGLIQLTIGTAEGDFAAGVEGNPTTNSWSSWLR